jgi:hypothetical protein
VTVKSGKLYRSLIRKVGQKVKKKMKVKENQKRWKAFDLFRIEVLEMPIIQYLNKTGIGRNNRMVEVVSENR